MPMEKGSNSLGFATTCFVCWMEQREGSEANLLLYINSKQVGKSHIHISPPQRSHHIFKDAVVLLPVPNSFPAIPTLVLDPCFSSGTGFVYKGGR